MRSRLGWLGVAALAGCGSPPANDAGGGQGGSPLAAALEIPCAPPGEAELRPVCTVDRVRDPAGVVLTLRLPDGGFHRLRVSEDGRTVTTADGAEPAQVATVGNQIEVAVGGARFHLPARGDKP